MSWFSIDLLVTLLVISVTHEIWHIYAPSDVAWSTEVIMVIAFAFIFSVAQAILGVNRISWSKATFADAYDLVPAWVVASVLVYVVNQQIHGFPPGLILIASGLAIGGFVFARYRTRLLTTLYYRLLRSKSRALAARERVLIVGSGRTAEHIAWMLGHPAYSNKFRIVGFVDDDLFAYGTRIYGANVIGEHKDIPQLVEKQDVGLIILADHHIDFQKFCSITRACDSTKARVVVAPDIFGSLNSLIGTTPAAPQAGSVRDAQNYRCMHCLARPALSEKETMVEEQGAAKAG
jgi:FlaA1/EpsC-like NDP-sugar epimerase